VLYVLIITKFIISEIFKRFLFSQKSVPSGASGWPGGGTLLGGRIFPFFNRSKLYDMNIFFERRN